MVFVDELRVRGSWRHGASSHLLPADDTPASIAALHAFASRIGMRREWFQDERRPHYDLTAARRERALRAGAVPTTTRAWLRRQQAIGPRDVARA